MASYCRAALQRLGPKAKARIPPAEPSTPTSTHSKSSSPSDEDLRYINYKLKQYQIKVEGKESRNLTPPLSKFAHKVKVKIGSLLHSKPKKRQDTPERYFQSPRHKIRYGSKRAVPQSPRNGLEVTESDRQRVESEISLEDIRLKFAAESDDDSAVIGLLYRRDLESDCPRLVRDRPAWSKPSFGDANSVESHHGVIVVEAEGLEPVEAREFV